MSISLSNVSILLYSESHSLGGLTLCKDSPLTCISDAVPTTLHGVFSFFLWSVFPQYPYYIICAYNDASSSWLMLKRALVIYYAEPVTSFSFYSRHFKQSCQACLGLTVGFLLLRYSVLCTVESLSLLYLLFISWFICPRRQFMDKLGIFHANQTSVCLDPHLN